MLALTFNIIMGTISFIVFSAVTISIAYAYKELKKPSIEEQVRQARNPYSTNKSFTSQH